MELFHFQEFITLAQSLHFQQAAELLYITQPTLSKHIKAMETELGCTLFKRARQGVELTEQGRIFLPYARQIAELERQYTAALFAAGQDQDRVCVGHIPLVTLYNFLDFFSAYQTDHPSAQYAAVQSYPQQLLELLDEQKSVDLILTSDLDVPVERFRKLLYIRDRLVVLLPASHPLSARDRIAVPELEQETLVDFTRAPGRQSHLSNVFPGLQSVIAVDREEVLTELVRKGLGLSILTQNVARHCTSEDVVMRPLSPAHELNIYMICRKGPHVKPIVQAMVRYLEKKWAEEAAAAE